MATTYERPRQAFPDGRTLPRSRSPVPPGPGRGRSSDETLVGALGWLSIALGVTSLVAPRGVARLIGTRGDHADETILRLVGLQEVACGLGLLGSRRPAGWVWARVAGDAVHLSMLSGALAVGTREPGRTAAATAAIAGITAVDAYAAARLSRRRGPAAVPAGRGPIEVRQSITIARPAEDLYRFWRDFRNLPRIMAHLEDVRVDASGRSHWVAKAPAGMTVAWDAEVIEDRPDERIAWRSVGGQVDTAGSVRFVPAPGGQGTEVRVAMSYAPPGGLLGKWFALLFGEAPEQQIHDDLRRLKQVMETGEVIRSEGSFEGSQLAQRPAQPPEAAPGR